MLQPVLPVLASSSALTGGSGHGRQETAHRAGEAPSPRFECSAIAPPGDSGPFSLLVRIMAEVAIVRRFVPVMAFHASGHGDGFFLAQNIPLAHRAMTGGAVHFSPFTVDLMREVHCPGQFVDPGPRNRLF